MKKMNLVFKRLGAKSMFTMILLFGLIIFTGQSVSAQYVSKGQAKEILDNYVKQLPAMPVVSKSAYKSNDKLIALGLKNNFGKIVLKGLKEDSSVSQLLDSAYEMLKGRVPAGKLSLLDNIKAEYAAMLKG